MNEYQKVVSASINKRCEETAASFTSKIATLEAQLAERDAQLASERAMADRLRSALEDALFIVRLVNHSGAAVVVDSALNALEQHKATRQPKEGA